MGNSKSYFQQAVDLFRVDNTHDSEAVALLYRSLYESAYRYSMRPIVAAWLGWAHRNGRGVPQDSYTALMWSRLAVSVLRNNSDPNVEWIKNLADSLESENPQPQPTPDQMYVWGLGLVKIKRGETYRYRIRETYAEVTNEKGRPYDMAVAWLWSDLQGREIERESSRSHLPEVLDETFCRDYPLFQLRLERGSGNAFSYRREGVRYTIIAPRTIRFEDCLSRELIINYGLKLMKLAAEEYLPQRLKAISERIGLGYSSCRISRSRNIIGRFYCRDKSIDLSMHLMKYSSLKIDSVIVHELCHGVEPNHNNEFYYAMERYGGAEILHADLHIGDEFVPFDV